ncbi:MAG: DUF2330 domain-containing protein, partial [candidate division WOR-3 bacterium]
FSYQVLQAFLADTLENYLTGHGYSLPSGTRDVFGYYLQKGWSYFFVARLADTALRYNYHNLGVSLEFASDSIVFPLYVSRMSSSESYVSLYVLAEHRQMFRGGRLRFSGKVKPGTFRYGGTFIDRPYHLTKLTKHFPRNEMQDICLQQAPDDQDYQEVVYSSPYWVMPLGLLCIPGLLLGWRQGSRRMFGASSKVQRLHHPS